MLELLLIFASAALIVIAFITIINVLTFPQLRPQPLADSPRVSILIPARNEAAVIQSTIQRILSQTYASFELLLLDDSSTDQTAEIALAAAGNDARFHLLHGEALPDGWAGKNWACHQLAQQAHGEILIFTDADVQWLPQALEAILAEFASTQADLLTIWPRQQTVTIAERLIVPLMAFVIMGYLPLLLVHHAPVAAFAAANGQCMVWKRRVYEGIGGHSGIRADVLDDVRLARSAKSSGFRLRMADANNLLHTRMYSGWQSVRDGYAKNILAGYGNSVLALSLAAIFHWVLFILPCLMLFVQDFQLWGLLLLILGAGTRMLSASFTRQRRLDALFMPVSVLLMTAVAIRSIYWHYTGGPRWKGRTLPDVASRGIQS